MYATTPTSTTITTLLLLFTILPFKRRLFKGYFTNRFRLEYFQSYITSSLYHFLIGRHNTNDGNIRNLWPVEKFILDAQN